MFTILYMKTLKPIFTFLLCMGFTAGCMRDTESTQKEEDKPKTEEKTKDTATNENSSPDDTVSTAEVEKNLNAPDDLVKAVENRDKNEKNIVKQVDKKDEIKTTPRDPLTPQEISALKSKRKYTAIGHFYAGLAVVKNDAGKFGYIDAHGTEVAPLKYDFAEDLNEHYGLGRVRIKDKVGFIDRTGQEAISLQYRYVEKFSRGLAHARMLDGEQFYIDQHGKHVCDILDNYHEGIARAKKGTKIGYVDTEGRVIIPTEYDYGTHFSQGMADVKKGDKHFFIDKTGRCVKDCE
jgi:hypothetical protein